MNQSKIYKIIQSSDFSSYLDQPSIELLSEIITDVQYKKTDTIYKSGQKISKLCIIYSGSCSLIDGSNNIIRELNENDFFGLVGLFTNSSKNYDLIANETTSVFELHKEDLEKLAQKSNTIKSQLLKIVNKRLFNPEINSALATVARGVDSNTIEELKKEISWKTLQDTEILFNEGDIGDSCYVIMSGRVEAIKNYGDDNEILLGELTRGDIIGDMALITEETRSATIKASKLTRLIHVSKKSFDKVMYDNPKALMEVSKSLINRLKFKEETNETQKNIIIGIVSLVNNEITNHVFENLNHGLKMFGSVESLNEVTSNIDFGKDNLDFEILLENIISNNDFLVLHSNDTKNVQWKKKIIQYADQIILLGDPKQCSSISNEESKIFGDYSNVNLKKIWLLLNHDENTTIPSNTNHIINLRKGLRTFHIRKNNSKDISKIVRFITKQTIGLTLGGGGAKGFAHFGVFKAMQELNIPIDIIGGTSAGSIVASQIALGYSLEEIIEKNKIVNSLNMFKEYGFPYISLIKSNKIEYAAKFSAADKNIEDLWIPFYAPATDLTNSKLVLFENGPLWEAIRASGALPGIVLPHFKNNSILVDGGLMNNLPVDIMKNKFGGNIICSSCSSDQDSKTLMKGIPNQFKLFFDSIFNKTLFKNKYKYVPTITDIIFKTSVVASASQIEKNIQMSNLFLELPMEEFGLTEFNNQSMIKMIDIAYDFSKPKLEKFKDTLTI